MSGSLATKLTPLSKASFRPLEIQTTSKVIIVLMNVPVNGCFMISSYVINNSGQDSCQMKLK